MFKWVISLRSLLKYWKEFGFSMLVKNGVTRLLTALRIPKTLADKYIRWKHKNIEDYLYEQYSHCLLDDFTEVLPENGRGNNVYVFWWQGESDAPETVKYCIQSIRRKSARNVVLLTKDNYREYVELPDYLVQKAMDGVLGLAHFSDIIRFYLLYRYGGVWIDATCYLTGEIPSVVDEYSFYSLKGPFHESPGLMWDWTSFYMAAQPGNVICKYMLAFYYAYWKEHNCAITYLFLDCWMNVIIKNNSEAKSIIDSIPCVDSSVFRLIEILNERANPNVLGELFKKTYVHKLTYKIPFVTDIAGGATNWGYILQSENTNAC